MKASGDMRPVIVLVRSALLVAVLLATSSQAKHARELLVHSYSESDAPKTVYWDSALPPGSEDLPFNHPQVVKVVPGTAPEQIHLTYVSPSQMLVTYVTGDSHMDGDLSGTDMRGTVPTFVQYSDTSSGPYLNASGTAEVYHQIYNFTNDYRIPNINYTSPLIHHVNLTGLEPDTTYYYIVGDPDFGTSKEINFTTMLPVGQFPVRLGLVADLGITYNSSTTLEHLIANEPEMVLYVGDFGYADVWMTNGTLAPNMRNSSATPYPASVLSSPYGTYQPKWDMWGRFTEPLFSRVPIQAVPGNHEIEPQYSAKNTSSVKFVSWKSRYPMPNWESGSPDPNYYSFDVGGAHVIGLSSYIPYEKGTPQFDWLLKDLAKVDRSLTPWVIVLNHGPWYNSYNSHYMELECMRQEMEETLDEYGVDLVFHGHVHAYERTFPVFNFQRQDCAKVHVTIGDGGNAEKLYRNFSDQATSEGDSLCPANTQNQPSYQPAHCKSFPYAHTASWRGGFCPKQQPEWSAYREPSFGHGMLIVENATHAVWQWHRNQDGAAEVSDETVFVRDPACRSRAAAPGPNPDDHGLYPLATAVYGGQAPSETPERRPNYASVVVDFPTREVAPSYALTVAETPTGDIGMAPNYASVVAETPMGNVAPNPPSEGPTPPAVGLEEGSGRAPNPTNAALLPPAPNPTEAVETLFVYDLAISEAESPIEQLAAVGGR